MHDGEFISGHLLEANLAASFQIELMSMINVIIGTVLIIVPQNIVLSWQLGIVPV